MEAPLRGNPIFVARLEASTPNAIAFDIAPTILARTANFLKTSATHYLESISPRGKDRYYAWGGLAGVAVTALAYALPDTPQFSIWMVPITAGVVKGVVTSAATGIASFLKYRGYLSDVQSRATEVGQAEIGKAEGVTTPQTQGQRIEQMGLAARQLAREKNRLTSMTSDQFQQRIHDIASDFVLGEADAVEEVKEALAKSLMDREEKYALFKSRMVSFTGGMAATTLLMNLTNFAFYMLTGEGLGQRIHEGLNAVREGWEQMMEPKAPLPAADQATPAPSPSPVPPRTPIPPSPTAAPPTPEPSPTGVPTPPPVETPQPAIPLVSTPVPAVPEAAAALITEAAPTSPVVTAPITAVEVAPPVPPAPAADVWQQAQQAGTLPHVDEETLARAGAVGSRLAEIDGSANSGIQEALTILRQNGFDSPSEATIRGVQEKILHLAEDLANSSDLPLALADRATYNEAYTNLLNSHLDQFHAIARQALIESQPAALEQLTAFHPYPGNFDTLALLQAVHEQGLNLDVTKLGGDTARILGTIYGGLDTVSGTHINYIDSADWSSRLTTTLGIRDRSEVAAFVKWVGVPQNEMADVFERLLAGDGVIFEQMVQALGATTPEKRAVIERLIEAASRQDPDALKIIQAIGHWKRSSTLNIPSHIKLLLEYKYGLSR